MLGNFLWNKYAFESSSMKFETEYLRKAAEKAEAASCRAHVFGKRNFHHWFGAMSQLHQELGDTQWECFDH